MTSLRIITDAESAMVQQAILPVIATGTDGSFCAVGTCWIFAIAGRDALAFSAKHVFDEVVRCEGRHEREAASIPDILRARKPRPISLQLTRLKAIYRHGMDQTLFLDIVQVHIDGLTDVAVCHLTFQSDAPADCLFQRKMAIHAGPVGSGTPVAVAGYAGMKVTHAHIAEEQGISQVAFFKQLRFEHGKSVEYFGVKGPRGPLGPCFEIDVPSQHGMSGGPILHKAYGDELVGCGVVSRGTAFGGDESTMAAALWPAYSFGINNLRGDGDEPLTRSI
jgi:hypothetical protein